MINIKVLYQLNCASQIAITEHARIRLNERGITVDDIISCISSGEIIEQYENDKPFPSCLILGLSANGKPIHVVASTDNEFIYLITSYFPNAIKWEADFKTRKGHKL